MTACLTMRDVGNAAAVLAWLFIILGPLVLLRHQAVERRRDRRNEHANAMRALARYRGNVPPA